MRNPGAVLVAAALTLSLSARADDEADLKESKERFETALKAMNEKCKTAITATYDLGKEKYERERYDSANKKWVFEPNRESGQFRLKKGWGYDFCTCALTAITSTCEKDDFKELIAAKVKKIECEHRPLSRFDRELMDNWDKNKALPPGLDAWEAGPSAAGGGVRHEHRDGVLKTFVDPDGANCGQYSAMYVTRKLGYVDLVAEKEARARFDDELGKMNEKCGTKITATYDLSKEKYERERYDSANKKWFMQPNDTSFGQFSLRRGWGYDFCTCAFKGIARNCDKDAFKEMIAAKVKSIECEHRPLAKLERELHDEWDVKHHEPAGYDLWEYYPAQMDNLRHEYKAGVLKTLVDPDGANCGEYSSKYVTLKLGFVEAERLKESKARFEEKLASMNEKCGTKITATYDLGSEHYDRERFDKANKKWVMQPNETGGQFKLWKGWGYDLCTCAFTGIESGCEKDAYKAALAKKIKSIQCAPKHLSKLETELTEKYNKTRKPPPGYERWEVDGQQEAIRHELANGVLKTFVDSDGANCGQYTRKYITTKVIK